MLALLTIICLVIIAVTMLIRANDLRWKRGLSFRWNARLAGLMLAGSSSAALALYGMFFPDHPLVELFRTVLYVGLAAVFVTTPGMPPWIHWIFKGDHGFHFDHPGHPENVPQRRSTDPK